MMKWIFPGLLFLTIGCAEQILPDNQIPKANPRSLPDSAKEVVVAEFQDLIDSARVIGSILIYDLDSNRYYSNDFSWAEQGHLPASTFKIINSIIALETGVIQSDSTVIKWDGKEKRMKRWEQDLIFRDAFHFSCVPCYQEIAKEIGAERMNESLAKLEYGDMQVDENNIDLFWLEGESKISQGQQIDFLKRFYHSELPISEGTEAMMKRMMLIAETEGYRLSGKTGWSVQNGQDNGWFVGYVETNTNVYFFATNIEPKAECDLGAFNRIRKEISVQAFKLLMEY